MPFDFPSAPTGGQTVTTPGGTYTWDGTKWVASPGTGGSGGGGTPSSAPPLMNSVADPGAATTYSRGDHVHPSDASRMPTTPQTFDSYLYGIAPDFKVVAGPVSWTGTQVTVQGATFTAADVNKTIIMPAGADAAGNSVPALVRIVSPGFTSNCTVDTTAAHAFTGASLTVTTDGGPTINAFGAGGSAVWDLLTMQGGGVIRPAQFVVRQIRPTSAAIVSPGGGGPPGATVYLRGTTGYGRRSLWQGVTDANGVLTGPLTLVDPGALYENPRDPTAEPLAADQRALTLPGNWAAGGPGPWTITLDPNLVAAGPVKLLRLGMSVAGTGIPGGTVITAISPDFYTVTLSKAPIVAGPGKVTYTENKVTASFRATWANNSTTLTATAALPSWVVADPTAGTLIEGVGLVGAADPRQPDAANTRIVALDVTRTIVTISQPTTQGVTQPAFVTMNPFLNGVTASLNFVPHTLYPTDTGVYSSWPTFPASVTGGANPGITITPPSRTLQVGYGTDNGTAFESWASDVRAACAAQQSLPSGQGISVGIEVLLRPGNYLSTRGINFVNCPGQSVTFNMAGASIHSCAADKVALDMRKGSFWVLENPTIFGDQYFPPRVGLAVGRIDTTLSHGVHVRSYNGGGFFNMAGLSVQNCEGATFTAPNVSNRKAPSRPAPPPIPPVPGTRATGTFTILVDAWSHWDIPCEFASVTMASNAFQSFDGLRMITASAYGQCGAIPWAISPGNQLQIINGYSASWGGAGVLYFGDGGVPCEIEMHMEVADGPNNTDQTGGLQDAFLLAGISNPIMQADFSFREYATDARNSIIACDTQAMFGPRANSLQTNLANIRVLSFPVNDAQVWDRFPTLTVGGLATITEWGGDVVLGGVNYASNGHLQNVPASRFGLTWRGETKHDLHLLGQGHFNDLVIDNSAIFQDGIVINDGGAIVNGGLIIGQSGLPTFGSWTQNQLLVGQTGSISAPSTAVPILSFAGPGNTVIDGGGPITDSRFIVHNRGTIDVEGYEGAGPLLFRVNGAITATGTVTLAADPTASLQAATKQYVDNHAPLGGPYLPTGGGTMTGALTYTATGGTTARSAQDRAGDLTSIMDFGGHLNGTISDTAAIGAALAVLGTNEPLVMPPGAASVVWGSVQNTTPTSPVLFKVDGVLSGGVAMLQAYNRVGKGDLFENFSNGTKFLAVRSGKADSGGVLRLEHNQVLGGGTGGFVNNILNIVAQDNTAAVTSMAGINVTMDSYSTQAGWPQNVAGSFTLNKHGKAWTAAVHITNQDDQNLPSSTGGVVVGTEMAVRVNGVDDAFNGSVIGSAGSRMGMHISLYEWGGTGAVLPGEISWGILFDGSVNCITKSILGVSTDMNTYQVLDARGALPPSGYTSPVAAVRMSSGQIVDFNGGTALNSAAGAYLQYRTATGRLYYVVAGVDQWSVDASGNVRARGTVTGSTTP